MKALKDHLILYDAECPMCNLYTGAFVKTGMLDRDGRAAYQHTTTYQCPQVNMQRAVNEIALVNTRTGEVTYGIRSLFSIIATSFPVFRPLFNSCIFTALMSKLYAFISYNRRVIIPAAETEDSFAYQPSFRLPYRIIWLLFTWCVTAAVLSAYAARLAPWVPAGSSYREWLICGGQIFFQAAVISCLAPAKAWDYLGNMMTISLAGALLLGISMPIARLLHATPAFYTGYFLLVAGAMLLEHIRRVKLLQLSVILSATWVLYRLVLLFILLKQ